MSNINIAALPSLLWILLSLSCSTILLAALTEGDSSISATVGQGLQDETSIVAVNEGQSQVYQPRVRIEVSQY